MVEIVFILVMIISCSLYAVCCFSYLGFFETRDTEVTQVVTTTTLTRNELANVWNAVDLEPAENSVVFKNFCERLGL